MGNDEVGEVVSQVLGEASYAYVELEGWGRFVQCRF